MSTLAPVRRQILVNTTPLRAFEVWTAQLASWWPFASHSVYGEGSTATFIDGRLIESGPDGSTCSWGTVSTWQPGERLEMTWHPGHDEDVATTVDVRFEPAPNDQTLVTLTHTGWENRADATSARDDYSTGWPVVMGRFVDLLGGSAA